MATIVVVREKADGIHMTKTERIDQLERQVEDLKRTVDLLQWQLKQTSPPCVPIYVERNRRWNDPPPYTVWTGDGTTTGEVTFEPPMRITC